MTADTAHLAPRRRRPRGARYTHPDHRDIPVRLRYAGFHDGEHEWLARPDWPGEDWSLQVDTWPARTSVIVGVGQHRLRTHTSPLVERWPFLARPVCWVRGHDWDSAHRPAIEGVTRIRDWCYRCEKIGRPR